MDFDRAAELADRIRKGENGNLRKQLIGMCIPYFWGVRMRFGFHEISYRDVAGELASDAVNNAIFFMRKSKSAFGIRLQNAFRTCCRQRCRYRRRLTAEELAEKCGLLYPVRTVESRLPPDLAAEQNERLELVRHELANHERTSRTAIYERMRGSSYQEIAMILGGKNTHQSRALFWDNLKRIRENLHVGKMEDQDGLQMMHNRQPVDED